MTTRDSGLLRRAGTLGAILTLALPYLGFSILRRAVSLDTLVRLAWQQSSRPLDALDSRALVARLRRLGRLCRQEGDCLPRSLLLYRRLSRHGANPRLVIGFARTNGVMTGHAWVVVNGMPLDEQDPTNMLTAVCVFGAGGRLLESHA